MKLLLIGPPASGKGTIGALLSEKVSLPIISLGKLLRDLPKNHPRYNEINALLLKGTLVPNDFLGALIMTRLQNDDCKSGFILDGWGRKFSDLSSFDPEVDWCIYLKVSDETVIKRISGRRMCKKDGRIYNIYTNPPKNGNICEVCDGEVERRADDTKEIAKKRLAEFKGISLETVEYYRKKGILVEIDAEGSPEIVLKDVLDALNL